MALILTHEKTDFDAVASQLGAKKLHPSAVALLPHHLNRNVQQFLNLYWDSLPFVRAADWRRRQVDEVILVDTHTLGNVRGLTANPKVLVIDHHLGHTPRPGWVYEVEPVGATSTLLVERLLERGLVLSPEEATLLLLGIYEDTGSLTYDTTTARDVHAAARMLEQGAQLTVARRFLNVALSEQQRQLYDSLLRNVEWLRIEERSIAIASAAVQPGFDDEISSVAHRLRETLTPDGLFVLVQLGDGVQVVARSLVDEIDVGLVARQLGGGGHSRAAAAMVVGGRIDQVSDKIRAALSQTVRPTMRVSALMSHSVQTVADTTPIREVADLMQRYGHEGYPVVDAHKKHIVGLVTRRGVDRAINHDMGGHPVDRIMHRGSITVKPTDTIERVQELMAAEGWGQIPVIAEDDESDSPLPIGIVTRTDLLNALFRSPPETLETDMRRRLAGSFSPELWALVRIVGETAARLQMPIYFVGGLVRDLLLGKPSTDLDIVIEGDAIRLVQELCRRFGGEVHSHDRFGTAKWSLGVESYEAILNTAAEEYPGKAVDEPNGSGSRMPAPGQIDFVSARKEFYKRPTALPDVEPGSIKLDLHRRDFTINTLAVRLDGDHLGQMLDFYGGRRDLRRGLIRVLHSLSFIDDPTRILRAVRLEQRLGFTIEENTADLIGAALPLLDRVSGERIRHEIELSLKEANPILVMERLDDLGVLRQLHDGLSWRGESAPVFARIPGYAADPLWGEVYRAGAPEFYYFAAWLAPFPKPIPELVAGRLRVRKATMDDLLGMDSLREVLAGLPDDAPPSKIVRAFGQFAPRTLLVVRILDQSPRAAAWLDRYMAEWRHVRTVVTGDDLRRAGLSPGPVYTRLLGRLLDARLDGEVQDDEAEFTLMKSLVSEALA
ncbi:MAG: CBS domain-containing protein [Candidatus Promineofilum sp.]|nr:CBS domain-containing protein [Promineifilum sp.]MBP9657824.1 CBS domain-containing protein [Promineifilum sp.]